METTRVSIRPLNPDNDREVQQLVALAERCPKSELLSDAVYSAQFWKRASGRRFTGLIAVVEGKIVAHFGLGTLGRYSRERGASTAGTASLSHIMIDPVAAHLVEQIGSGLRVVIGNQMSRKEITCLLALQSSGNQGSAALLQHLGLKPVAAFEDSSRFLQLFARSLETTPRSLEYLPAQLKEVVSSTLQALDIPTSTTEAAELADAVPADDLSVQPLPFSKGRRVLLLLTPSLLCRSAGGTIDRSSIDSLLKRRSTALLGIKLSDRGCTDLTRIVQSLGYEYCGILPSLFGRDSILFAKRQVSTRPFHSLQRVTAQRV
jgi:hypothetical protein